MGPSASDEGPAGLRGPLVSTETLTTSARRAAGSVHQPTPGAPWVDQKHPSSEPNRLVARGWLSGSECRVAPRSTRSWGRLLGDAREAVDVQRRRQSLYMWFGPLVLDATEDGLTGIEILRKGGY